VSRGISFTRKLDDVNTLLSVDRGKKKESQHEKSWHDSFLPILYGIAILSPYFSLRF
jgi:hypothetical protein